MTIITLSNGKKVGNFSSPHPFTFEDGSILYPVIPKEAERLKVEFIEEPINDKGDLKLYFRITNDIGTEVSLWLSAHEAGEVDVVYCPLPMITALKETMGEEWLIESPFRAIRMEDRIRKLVSIHKQCV